MAEKVITLPEAFSTQTFGPIDSSGNIAIDASSGICYGYIEKELYMIKTYKVSLEDSIFILQEAISLVPPGKIKTKIKMDESVSDWITIGKI